MHEPRYPTEPGRALGRAAGLAAALALAVAGCAAPATKATLDVKVEVLDALKRYELAYLLQPGDVVEVNVHRQPEFTRKVIVRPDGYISLPVVQDLMAAGKAPRQLGAEVQERLAQRLRKPEVSIIVEATPEPMVYVVGSVNAPKPVPLRQARTVAQALAHAGDATKAAALGDIAIIRLSADGRLESHKVAVEGAAPSQPEYYMALGNMALRANDLVLVPESYRGQAMRTVMDINTVLAPVYSLRLLDVVY